MAVKDLFKNAGIDPKDPRAVARAREIQAKIDSLPNQPTSVEVPDISGLEDRLLKAATATAVTKQELANPEVRRNLVNMAGFTDEEKLRLEQAGFLPSEIQNIEDSKGRFETARTGLDVADKPTATKLRILEQAMRAKTDPAKKPGTQSDLFKRLGISGYDTLMADADQRLNEMGLRYDNFTDKLDSVAGFLSDTWRNTAENYRIARDEYQLQVDSMRSALNNLAARERQMELLDKQNQIWEDQQSFLAELEAKQPLSIDDQIKLTEGGFTFDKDSGTVRKLTIRDEVDPNKPGSSTLVNYNRLFFGSEANSDGLDLTIDVGQEVSAPVSGKVVSVFATCKPGDQQCNGGWGNQIVIMDENGFKHTINHLDSVDERILEALSKGGKIAVERGMLIANSGNTGRVLGADSQGNAVELTKAQIVEDGRGAHVDYTVFDPSGRRLSVDEVIPFAFPEVAEDFRTFSVEAATDVPMFSPKQIADFEDSQAKRVDSLSKASKEAIRQVNLINKSLELAKEKIENGESVNAASQGILVAFQKLLDPTSVVRESEYARSGDGQALLQSIQGQFNKISQGGAGVTLEGLEEFVETANAFAAGYQESLLDIALQVDKIATNRGLNIENILTPETLGILRKRQEEIDGKSFDSGADFSSWFDALN